MKMCKYYSIDECKTRDSVFEELDRLQEEEKIDYTYIDDDEVIKISEEVLTTKEKKTLKSFFKENDILDYPEYEEYLEEDEYLEDGDDIDDEDDLEEDD